MMVETFIRRPVLSLVISLILILLGVLALFQLPITQFPDIVPPSVVVTASYNGANAEVCAKAVATPLERAINGVPGMTYMNSVSSNNGITLVQVFFNVGTDPDQAAVNVQNRVTTVLDELPEEVIKAGVTTEKEVNSMLLYLNVTSTDKEMNEEFIYNFADINVLQELKRIDGVGFVEIMGARDYSMRVWLKPDRMRSYNLSVDEVVDMMRKQNIEAAPGVAGENSGIGKEVKQYVLRYSGKFNSKQAYENLVLKAGRDGALIRLKDVADLEFGTVSYDMVSKTDGRPSASIMIKQRPGSNASDVIDNIKTKMKELKSTTFPPGMQYNYAYDVSRFLDASIHEVLRTLVEAFILVFLVVFIFLQDFRSTLIPALAVPVALISTLAFLQIMGFSINMLTLFALVLAIGIVVDNAIVVVEAVHVKMSQDHLPPMEATIAAMKEISGAIIAITLVMSAVFVPVAFLSGPVGVFYRQFSLTLAISIVISGVNALTLTPALCALMLKHEKPENTRKKLSQRVFNLFNRGYDATERKFGKLVSLVIGRKPVTIVLLLFFFLATWAGAKILPSGFIPTEDQGMIYINVTTPPGSTVERTEKVLDQVQQVTKSIKSVENISTLAGYSVMSEITGASYGMGMINLSPWDSRTESVEELIAVLKQKTSHISDASIEFFSPPTVPGFGNASGFELRLLDKNKGEDLSKTASVTNAFLKEMNDSDEITGAFTSFDPNFPQYMIHIDQDMAAQKGITIDNAMNTLQALVGSYYATNFIRFGQVYKVMIQAYPQYRGKPNDLLKLYVKNNRGEMIPYSSFISLERVYGPEQINRYNMYPSAMITGDANTGFSSSDAIQKVEETAAKNLPRGFSIEWSGMTREQILSGNQAFYIFALCLLFVYLLLAAQYESFVLPLPVLLSLPAGIAGAFFTLKLAGLENNIYAQVALVMLIGLLGKNAILIIEFAEQKRKQGYPVRKAAQLGAVSRLRPILMTSFAFVVGLIPLCVASGAGAVGNRSIGMTAVGGMLIGTLFGVIIIPGLYALLAPKGKIKPKPVQVVILAIALFGLSSCRSIKQDKLPAMQVIPENFSHSKAISKDTLSWHSFFNQPGLKKLIDSAMLQNLDIKSGLQQIFIAGANLKLSRASLLPTLDARISAGLDQYGKYTMNGVGNYDTNFSENLNVDQHIPNPTPDFFVGFRSSWEIDVWGKMSSRKKAAYHRFLASQKAVKWYQTQLISQVAELYYELISLDKRKEILERNVALQNKGLEVVEAQLLGGRATALAVSQFKAQRTATQGKAYEIKQAMVKVENQLNLLLGRYAAKIERDTNGMALPLPKQVYAGIPWTVIFSRPDVQEAEEKLSSAKADVSAARKAFLPSFTLDAYAGYNSFKAPLLFSPGSLAAGFLGGLTAPILNRSALKKNNRVANATQRNAYYQYQKSLINAYQEVTGQLSALANYQQAYELKTTEVNELKNAVATANDLYLAGYASYLEVIVAQASVLNAEMEQVSLKQSSYNALIGLFRAVGGNH